MADEAPQENSTNGGGNQIYYILGAVILVAIIAAGYFLRPQNVTSPSAPTIAIPVIPTPTPGLITALACEKQYYNPVIGFAKYYVSAQGVDLANASKVDCDITVSIAGKVVATESASSPLTSSPERNGATFRCTTKGMALTPTVVSKVDFAIKDDLGKTASCTSTFTFPAP